MQKFDFKNICCSTKYCYSFLLLFLVGQFAVAQNQVKGTVSDSNGVTLLGVSVIEKGTTNGVVSDFDGNYVINVSESATLVFSYVGFATKEIEVNNKELINVTLVESVEGLSEVVVIGYGSQRKEQLSGSVSSVDTEALETIPQVGIDQMMQGRAAGVSITQNSGQPGSAVSVRIRGVNTITGSSEPLYIIDGVPVSGDSNNTGTSGRSIADNGLGESSGSTGVSPLSALNPNDVESIDILKDASATAIYGSRGSNGVVIITTKKGKNTKGTLAYNTFLAVQRPTNLIEVLDLPGYARLQNEIGEIYGLNPRISFLNPSLLGPGTNWQKEIFSDAIMQNHQVSFSGGNDGINYFLSSGYVDQEGTVIGSSFDRISLRANVNAKLNKSINVGASFTMSRTNESLTLNNSTNGLIGLSLRNNPATAVYNPDGSFAGPVTNDEIAFGIRNPIAEALSIRNNLTRNRVLGNIFSEFKLSENFTYRLEVGGDFGNNISNRFQPTFSYGAIERGTNSLNIRNENTDFWIVKNLLTFNKSFNDIHNFTVLLGHEVQESSWEGTIAQDGDFVSNDVPILGTGDANDFTDQYKGSAALESYFGRLIYSLDNKYNVTASLRADGSSKFAEGNKWGYFPSVSAAWRLSNESFMEGFTAIENIKLYGGYGEVGNQNIPNFAYGARLNTISTGNGTGFEYANFANEDLTWESSTQTNLGLNFTLFNSRLNTTVEVYKKVSKDFLYQLAVTDFITGGNSPGAITPPWVNLGEMQNTGIDVTLSYKTDAKDFNWSSSLTVSHYKNKVNALLGDLTINGDLTLDNSNQNITLTQVGQPIGLFYGYQVEGLFRTLDDINGAPIQFGRPFEDALFGSTWLGDVKYKDVSGPNGVPDGVIDGDDRTVIGDPHPDFTFGFQNSFSYKSFDLSVFMQGSYGNDIFNAIGRSLTAGNRTYTNQLPSVLDYWSIDNPNAGSPRLARNDTPNINISDRYIEDGSYLRIQNVTLGYTLPSRFSNDIGLSKLKVYGSIQNLHTFTNYSGYDPEVGAYNQNALLLGVDNGRYPSPRTFTLGINVEF
ncbi:SusC/RagA family TonB-linked outer membrane protein [Winogradskyella sp. SM1960]|uniref:SusC/RagA family TonB-linked outer membrane protein n=1 Tax=Winogradskyella sp. SM1960 TaxID=2865955 RepID=UPI001CD5B6A3|nr:TonB-dependent receptor [Winogradskyella sp. SM1960]